MERLIEDFLEYLHNVKNTSANTIMSYKRDLLKWDDYMGTLGIIKIEEVNKEHLLSFIEYLEKKKFKAATISRNIASIKAFYHYLFKQRVIEEDISDCLPEGLRSEETKKGYLQLLPSEWSDGFFMAKLRKKK